MRSLPAPPWSVSLVVSSASWDHFPAECENAYAAPVPGAPITAVAPTIATEWPRVPSAAPFVAVSSASRDQFPAECENTTAAPGFVNGFGPGAPITVVGPSIATERPKRASPKEDGAVSSVSCDHLPAARTNTYAAPVSEFLLGAP